MKVKAEIFNPSSNQSYGLYLIVNFNFSSFVLDIFAKTLIDIPTYNVT